MPPLTQRTRRRRRRTHGHGRCTLSRCVHAAHDAPVTHEGACGRRAGCVKGGGQASVSAHRCGGGVGMLSAPGAHDWRGGIKARGNGAAGMCSASAAGAHGGERRGQRGARQRRQLRRPCFVCTHHDIRVTLHARLSSALTTVSTNDFIFCFKGSPARSASHARRTASSAPAKLASIASISTEGKDRRRVLLSPLVGAHRGHTRAQNGGGVCF